MIAEVKSRLTDNRSAASESVRAGIFIRVVIITFWSFSRHILKYRVLVNYIVKNDYIIHYYSFPIHKYNIIWIYYENNSSKYYIKVFKTDEFEILIRFAMINSLITLSPHSITRQGLKHLQTWHKWHIKNDVRFNLHKWWGGSELCNVNFTN